MTSFGTFKTFTRKKKGHYIMIKISEETFQRMINAPSRVKKDCKGKVKVPKRTMFVDMVYRTISINYYDSKNRLINQIEYVVEQ